MASRLDAIQVAVPRVADSASQQAAAQRQPVVVQEHVAAANRQEAEIRQERTESLHRRDGRQIRNDLVPPTREREPGTKNPRKRPQTAQRPAATGPSPTEPSGDGKGLRIDLRL